MSQYAVVAVHRDGHRTVLQGTVTMNRAECERIALRRNSHPNALALGMTHEVVTVIEGARSCLDAAPGFIEFAGGSL